MTVLCGSQSQHPVAGLKLAPVGDWDENFEYEFQILGAAVTTLMCLKNAVTVVNGKIMVFRALMPVPISDCTRSCPLSLYCCY
jgi:hypothetical protein